MTREAELQFEALAKQQDESPAIDVIDELPELFEGKTRLATVPVRIHQARFRRQVLASYDAACCICGLSDPRLLIASHIVPWSQDQANRLNPSNGLCLSALHDKAYDAGLITVLPDYTIRVSRALLKKPSDAFLTATLASYDGTKIRLPRRFRPTPELLEKHARRFDFLR